MIDGKREGERVDEQRGLRVVTRELIREAWGKDNTLVSQLHGGTFVCCCPSALSDAF